MQFSAIQRKIFELHFFFNSSRIEYKFFKVATFSLGYYYNYTLIILERPSEYSVNGFDGQRFRQRFV